MKPHYHVIYIAKNPVTANSVRQKIQKLLGVDALAEVKIIATSVRNMYDYLTHESVDAIAKKKHVYDKKDILCLNNFDIDRYDELENGSEIGITINNFRNVIDGKSSMLRLYFDGAYQISKRKEGELEKLAADWMDVARRQSEELTTLKAKLKKFEEK